MSASVLVVDDSSFIVEGMVSILERHDYRAMAAHSGEECLKILETETPDIIILDILMEPMDGWETLVRIRKDSGRGVDVVLDSIGGDAFHKSWGLLEPYGRHVLFGAAAAVKPGAIARLGALWRLRRMLLVSPLAMIDKNRTLSGFNLYHMASRSDLLREAAARMLELRVQGVVKPRVGLALPLEKAAEAHRRLQDRRTVGKVVLTVG